MTQSVQILFSPAQLTKEFQYLLNLFGLVGSVQLNVLSPVKSSANSTSSTVAPPVFKNLSGYKLVTKDLASLAAASSSWKWLGHNPKEYSLVENWLEKFDSNSVVKPDEVKKYWVLFVL